MSCSIPYVPQGSFAINPLRKWIVLMLLASVASASSQSIPAASSDVSLKVEYGAKGIQTISYGGVKLEDVAQYPNDTFHIWHMKATDLSGAPSDNNQAGWGEINNGQSWNAMTQTETYTFNWGAIAVQFVQHGDSLDLVVTETNNPGSGILFDGAEIYPFILHFPHDPVGFNGYSQYAITTIEPGVSVADYGAGVVTSVIPDESQPLYGGWKTSSTAAYSPLMSGTAPDGLPIFAPKNDLPVAPGTTVSYTVSLRFSPEGSSVSAADAYTSFAATYPSQMTWTDKRVIGTVYLASSPDGSTGVTTPGGFPTNPRRYFNDPTVDVTTPAGLRAFQARILNKAADTVTNALALKSQGVIIWDIEGEQFPQNTSYVCSPDQIASVAPEMESVITDQNSGFAGQRLDDAYFKIIANAGLRSGVCLRPQVFTRGANGTASQVTLVANADIIRNVENKALYANSRWGTTLFYVDSTVDVNGGTLDPAIFQQLITDMPSFLFVPEESTPRYYAYAAPFYTFLFHSDLGTPSSIYNVYPRAFGANLINDVASSLLASDLPQLTQAVKNGDILMGHADFWQGNNPTLLAIYEAAGNSGSHPKVKPVLNWSAPPAITYGSPLSTSQLDVLASTSGALTYTPSVGAILPAGDRALLATFSPTDTQDFTSNTASVVLTVRKATPVINWSAPAPISSADPLSAVQLNATANVPGTFAFTPAAGTLLTSGKNTLQAFFYPSDSSNYQSVASSVAISVTPKNGSAACYPLYTGALICSAAQDATASSTVSVVAGATAGSGYITAIRVYVDNVAAALVNNPQRSKSFAINTPIVFSKGRHNVVAVGYQSTGGAVTASDKLTVQ